MYFANKQLLSVNVPGGGNEHFSPIQSSENISVGRGVFLLWPGQILGAAPGTQY